MGDRYNHKFGIKLTDTWGWHIGVNFCISPKANNGKREVYLLVCLGNHDLVIGYIIHDNEEE